MKETILIPKETIFNFNGCAITPVQDTMFYIETYDIQKLIKIGYTLENNYPYWEIKK